MKPNRCIQPPEQPSTSWWAQPLTFQQFAEKAKQEAERMQQDTKFAKTDIPAQ